MPRDDAGTGTDPIIATLIANHRRFLNFLEARVGSRHDAEEILQGAFVRSLQKADEIRDSEGAIAWFYRLLRNAAVDHFRREAAGHRSLEVFASRLSDPAGAPDPSTERVICECVRDLVSVLKPEHADLITQIDLRGMDTAAVADSLGITQGNARVRLHRARAALRQEVERTCRTCAIHRCIDCTCNREG